MKIKSLIFLSLLTCNLKILAQEAQPYNNGEKIILEKIEKYKNIDTLNHYSPTKASRENRTLNYEVWKNEGEITINNVAKGHFGIGGFTSYKFIDKKNKKKLKFEYNQTKHIYKDSKLEHHLNSETQRITVFFNNDDKPDFAKIIATQYLDDKLISSQLSYLNLYKEQDYYVSSEIHALIKNILFIISN